MKHLLIFLLTLSFCAPSDAVIPRGNGGAAAPYVGPGDIVSGAYLWYGLRAYSSAVAATGTQAAINVIRASDSHTCDLLITTTGTLGNTANCSTGGDNGQSCTAFLTSTTGNVGTWYDQTGNGRDATQSTGAKKPLLFCSSGGPSSGKPRMLWGTNGSECLQIANSSLASPQSMSFVAHPLTGLVGGEVIRFGNTGIIYTRLGSNLLKGYAGTELSAAATDNVWHAGQAVFNGASGAIMVDGSDTTGLSMGTNAPSTTRGAVGCDPDGGLFDAAFFVGDMVEAGVWNAAAFSSGNRTSINANQHTYWGF